ncbi:hypothetical protein R6Q59_010692 [Mikania micrantha]
MSIYRRCFQLTTSVFRLVTATTGAERTFSSIKHAKMELRKTGLLRSSLSIPTGIGVRFVSILPPDPTLSGIFTGDVNRLEVEDEPFTVEFGHNYCQMLLINSRLSSISPVIAPTIRRVRFGSS